MKAVLHYYLSCETRPLLQCICICSTQASEQLQVTSAVWTILYLFAANPITEKNRASVNSNYTNLLSV